MNSFQAGIVISLGCYLAIGWYAGSGSNTSRTFCRRAQCPHVLILGTLVASFMSTNAFMGEAGMSYQGHAPLVIIMTCFNCLGYIVGAVFFGRYLRRSRALTVPDFFAPGSTAVAYRSSPAFRLWPVCLLIYWP